MSNLRTSGCHSKTGAQQIWALVLYVILGLLFVMSSYGQTNQCIELYQRDSARVLKPVFNTPRDTNDTFELGQDGVTHVNLFNDTIYSRTPGLQSRVIPETKDSSNPILEIIGTSPKKNSTFEFYTGDGVFKNVSRFSGGQYIGRAHSSGIRLHVSSWDPNAEITLTIRPQSAHATIETYTFKAGREPTEIYIPWSQFKAVHGVPFKPFFDADTGHYVKEDSFVFSVKGTNVTDNGTAASHFGLRFHGPLVFERDLVNDPKLLAFVANFDYSISGSIAGGLDYGNKVDARDSRFFPDDGRTTFYQSTKQDSVTLRKAIHNYHQRNNQEEVAWLTDREVIAEIKKEGWDIVYFEEKLSDKKMEKIFGSGSNVQLFFGSQSDLNYISPKVDSDLSTSPYFKTGKHTPRVPGERGSFGIDHGTLSHARQILAMIKGMTKKEKENLKAIVGSMFGTNSRRWMIWDIVFDSGGNSLPNSPRFWRDLVAEMHARRFENQ